ncbi:unnamed protein product [Protopolystoma xenopodis]|uniref:Uncharacterized protein n=1 Tax=Protopolystoma xenopodis TaxID=117903 RepID=A0A448WY12_9PLAT|nr:unnamed protein product [Protopolystoma xenopodis]
MKPQPPSGDVMTPVSPPIVNVYRTCLNACSSASAVTQKPSQSVRNGLRLAGRNWSRLTQSCRPQAWS